MEHPIPRSFTAKMSLCQFSQERGATQYVLQNPKSTAFLASLPYHRNHNTTNICIYKSFMQVDHPPLFYYMPLPGTLPTKPYSNMEKKQKNPTKRLQQHLPRVLNVLLDLYQKGNGFPTVEQSVVVCERKVHHGSNLHLSVDRNRLLLDRV